MKALCQWMATLATVVVSGAVWGGKQVDLSQSRKYPGQEGHSYAEEQERMPLRITSTSRR